MQTPSFRVSARRADKRFPLTSPQIEREVGGRIREFDATTQCAGFLVGTFVYDEIWHPALDRALAHGAVTCYLTRNIDDPLHFRQVSVWEGWQTAQASFPL